MKRRAYIFLVTGLLVSMGSGQCANAELCSTQLAQAKASDAVSQDALAVAVDNDAQGLPELTKTRELNAPIAKVWNAIQARRSSDPKKRKLLSYDGKVAVVKETFASMPIIGSSSCTYAERELASLKAIPFKMMNSTRFKAFGGVWRLSDGSKPGTTKVSLTTYLDPGVRVPFWQKIAKGSMDRNLSGTLDELNRLVSN